MAPTYTSLSSSTFSSIEEEIWNTIVDPGLKERSRSKSFLSTTDAASSTTSRFSTPSEVETNSKVAVDGPPAHHDTHPTPAAGCNPLLIEGIPRIHMSFRFGHSSPLVGPAVLSCEPQRVNQVQEAPTTKSTTQKRARKRTEPSTPSSKRARSEAQSNPPRPEVEPPTSQSTSTPPTPTCYISCLWPSEDDPDEPCGEQLRFNNAVLRNHIIQKHGHGRDTLICLWRCDGGGPCLLGEKPMKAKSIGRHVTTKGHILNENKDCMSVAEKAGAPSMLSCGLCGTEFRIPVGARNTLSRHQQSKKCQEERKKRLAEGNPEEQEART